MKVRKVLLVEDEEGIHHLLAECLAEAGFDVLEAATGDEAIRLLVGPDDIDLLVTDIRMPGCTDGNQVSEAARARSPGLPVVYMTGDPSSVRIRPGARDMLVKKPFAPSEVLAAVLGLLAAPDPSSVHQGNSIADQSGRQLSQTALGRSDVSRP